MTRGSFLKLQIPNLPYCEFHLENPYRTVSNGHSETLHVKNARKNHQINIWWSCWNNFTDKKNSVDIGEVTVNYHDLNEKNQHKRIHTIINGDKHFTQEKLIEVFKKIMY